MSERALIEAVIQTYFDGLYDGDVNKLRAIFAPTATLTFENRGERITLTREEWLANVAARPKPRAQQLERDDALLLFDQAGPTTALVKVKCQIPPLYFTDYLALLKTDGRWMIVQKIYAARKAA
jgi:hypothetical protein